MLRDNLVELIEPMLNSAGANPLALTHHQIQASGDRLPCLENPRPKGAESSLTENVTSPFQAEPAQNNINSPASDSDLRVVVNVSAIPCGIENNGIPRHCHSEKTLHLH